MKICVLGLGYVGLPLAVRAAEVGHSVVGIDPDTRKISSLRAGTSYIEDVTDDRLSTVVGNYRLVTNPRLLESHNHFDVCIVTVPTPLRNGEPDLSSVIAAGEQIGTILDPNLMPAVVLESTSYPGTTEGPFAEAIASPRGYQPGLHYHLGFSPERIDPGNSEYTLENTPKLVAGATPAARKKIQAFYDTIVDITVPVSSIKVAELAKVFENVQAYVGIALINEVADLARDLDIDVHEMVEASMTKGHSMIRWVPGPGVGGHCLPIDSAYLMWQAREHLGRSFKMAELATEINENRPHQVVDRAIELLAGRGIRTRDAQVLLLGTAYKPGVGDLRESPALSIAADLTGRGAAVVVCDPLVENWTLTPTLSIEELPAAVADYDLVIVVTDHALFDYDKVAREAVQVLDTRNAMRPSKRVMFL